MIKEYSIAAFIAVTSLTMAHLTNSASFLVTHPYHLITVEDETGRVRGISIVCEADGLTVSTPSLCPYVVQKK